MSESASQISYLNTDLDLTSVEDLRPLAGEIEKRGLTTLNAYDEGDGRWYGLLEIAADLQIHEPEATIRVMLDAIESLEADAKLVWDGCGKKDFNIGYDCGDEPWEFNNGLSNETLARIARLGASLRITVYPLRPEQDQAATP